MRHIRVSKYGFSVPFVDGSSTNFEIGDIFEYEVVEHIMETSYGLSRREDYFVNNKECHLQYKTLEANLIGKGGKIFSDITKQVERNRKLEELGL